MTSFFGELRRRNVVRVAVAYAIVGWVLVEVSSVLLPAFEAPDWVLRVIVLFVGVGFVLALILSWAYEITPNGMKRSHEVEAAESITHVTGRKLDFAIIGALVLVLGFVVYNYVLVDSDQEAVVQETATSLEPATESTAPGEVQRDILPNSVAVLPLDNLSPDPEHAYFAQGLHDAIISQLARIRDLNVIGRTSVLRYAGVSQPMSEIAKELRVEMLLEGSVRYDGDRIRVTAQLIDGETETHLWVEEYEGDLADIFGIQASIASRIAEALQVQLSPVEQARMTRPATASPAATALYLRAFTVSDVAGILSPGGVAAGAPFIDEALRLDPSFAQALALKAEFHANAGEDVEAIEAANRALELIPDLPEAYVALGRAHMRRWRGAEAQAAYERALELSPKSIRFVQEYSRFNSYLNRHDAAINLAKQAIELDPNNPNAYHYLLYAHAFAGDAEGVREAAVTLRELAPEESITYRNSGLAEIMLGNPDEALRYLRLAERLDPSAVSLSEVGRLAYAFRMGGFYDDALRVLTSGNARRRDVETRLAVGDQAGALTALRAAVENEVIASFPLIRIKANIWQDPVLDQPEFQELRDQLVFED